MPPFVCGRSKVKVFVAVRVPERSVFAMLRDASKTPANRFAEIASKSNATPPVPTFASGRPIAREQAVQLAHTARAASR